MSALCSDCCIQFILESRIAVGCRLEFELAFCDSLDDAVDMRSSIAVGHERAFSEAKEEKHGVSYQCR